MNNEDRLKLSKLTISGFKSFDSNEHTIEFGDVTVLIGANGAGKSNVVSFFKMIGAMMAGKLQLFVGEQGFASSLLFRGTKTTSEIKAEVHFSTPEGPQDYHFTLVLSPPDRLFFRNEKGGKPGLGIANIAGGPESNFREPYEAIPGFGGRGDWAQILREILVFQFHDTSPSSRFRNSVYINDNQFLRSDGGNLAAFLYGLKESKEDRNYYQRIVRHISRAFPQFGDFEMRPSAGNENQIILNWTEDGNGDYLMGPHQISDGSLRFMALATLLLQPPENLPSVIVIDEPELGLHPSAISELAAMVEIASRYSQVVLSTQSSRLLDEFGPENVVVVERDPITKSSFFPNLNSVQLEEWLERYSLSELWEKNVLGGQP